MHGRERGNDTTNNCMRHKETKEVHCLYSSRNTLIFPISILKPSTLFRARAQAPVDCSVFSSSSRPKVSKDTETQSPRTPTTFSTPFLLTAPTSSPSATGAARITTRAPASMYLGEAYGSNSSRDGEIKTHARVEKVIIIKDQQENQEN